jgi:hypothetical protein
MPLSGSVLSNLMKQRVDANIKSVGGPGPLGQEKTVYFKKMMDAIGGGTVSGTAGTLSFVSSNPPPPVPTSPFSANGLKFDSSYFEKTLYNKLRTLSLGITGKTLHDPYPPSPKNSGEYLKAICAGLGEAIEKHFKSAPILLSPQTSPSSSKIEKGSFSGLIPQTISQNIISLASGLNGVFFPQFALAYANVYVITVHTKTESETEGNWVPGGLVS